MKDSGVPAQLLTEEGVKLLIKIAGEVFKWGKEKTRDSIQWHRACARYIDHFAERHGNVKILGLAQPVPLQDIYTAVQCVSPKYLQTFATEEELEKNIRTNGKRGFLPHKSKPEDALGVANRNQFLSVLGQPGAGKSTFLRRLGFEMLLPRQQRAYKHDCLPVFIDLKTFKTIPINLPEIIQNTFALADFPNPVLFTEKALENGKLLILLDGVDEIPMEKIDAAIEHISNFVDRYSENRVVISCRTAFYNSWFERFTDVVISDFDLNQIKHFVNNWFRNQIDVEQKTVEEFWSLLQQQPATLELATTPLLLTFLCITYDATQSLPSNRAALYEEALKILLEKWAAEKRIRREMPYDGFTTKLEVLLLEQLAGKAFEEDKIFLSQDEIVRNIEEFFKDELNAPKGMDGLKILNAIEVQQGLLVQRSHEFHSFSHLTLQEYLAAKYFIDHGKIHRLIEHCGDPRWREVFLLAAGVTRADDLLLRMSRRLAFQLQSQTRPLRLIHWSCQNAADSANPSTVVAHRALVLLVLVTMIRRKQGLESYSFARQRLAETIRAMVYDFGVENWEIAKQTDRIDQRRSFFCSPDLQQAIGDWEGLLRGDRVEPRLADALDDVDSLVLSEQSSEGGVSWAWHCSVCLGRLENRGLFKSGIGQRAASEMRNLASRLEHEPPSDSKSLSVEAILQIALTALGVDEDLLDLKEEEIEVLEAYLKWTAFIVECRKASVSVTTEGWRRVLKNMLQIA